MSKSPSFQFYPADWLNDIKLQSCSLQAQGLLINMICLMHQSKKYGFLSPNSSHFDSKTLAKLLRIDRKKFQKFSQELVKNEVLIVGNCGSFICKRMVEDQNLRDIRAQSGRKGGSPVLVKQNDNQSVDQKTPPSSSSSSSSSSSGTKDEKDGGAIAPLSPDGDGASNCPHQEIIKAYHEILPSLPSVKVWNDAQQKILRTRWKEDPVRQSVNWWRSFFGFISESDFLMGRKTEFMADLEWLVRPTNFAKIANGRYHHGQSWKGKVSANTARSIMNMDKWAKEKFNEA